MLPKLCRQKEEEEIQFKVYNIHKVSPNGVA